MIAITVLGCNQNIQPLEYGVITLSNAFQNGSINLFDEDGSDYCKISFDPMDTLPSNFDPLAFHPDYFVLVLAVKKKLNDSKYLVYINSEETKVVDLEANMLIFENWHDHLKKRVTNVSFNSQMVKLFDMPKEDADVLAEISGSALFQIYEVNGDWLKIGPIDPHVHSKSGWIQWKKDQEIIPTLHYFK